MRDLGGEQPQAVCRSEAGRTHRAGGGQGGILLLTTNHEGWSYECVLFSVLLTIDRESQSIQGGALCLEELF
jgi:hypothetical protein